MLAVDPGIEIQACGNRNSPNDSWNETLLETAGDQLDTVTDHILAGGIVDEGTDPDELFHAFMGYADPLGKEYRALRERMPAAGIDTPALRSRNSSCSQISIRTARSAIMAPC